MPGIEIGPGISIGGGIGVGSGTGGGGGGGAGGYPLTYGFDDGSEYVGINFQYTPNPTGTVITCASFQTLYKSTFSFGWQTVSYAGRTTFDASSVLGSYIIADGCGAWNANGSALQVLVYTGGGMSPATGRFGSLACSTPYDISTVTGFTASSNTLYTDFGNVPRALVFGNSGNKVYFLRGGNLWQYDLSTPYDTFSLSGSGTIINVFGILNMTGNPTGFAITSNGLVGLLLNGGNFGDGDVTQFTLGTAWDVSSLNASPTTVTRMSTISGAGNNITDATNAGLMISPATDYLWITALNPSFNNALYSYTVTPTP